MRNVENDFKCRNSTWGLGEATLCRPRLWGDLMIYVLQPGPLCEAGRISAGRPR